MNLTWLLPVLLLVVTVLGVVDAVLEAPTGTEPLGTLDTLDRR